MYKLIALDMDGTLLDSQKALTSRVCAAIAKAKAQGVKVVLASGRPFEGMLPTLKALGLDGEEDYVLTYNASLILKVACKTVVSRAILKGQDAIELHQLANELGVNILAYSMTRGLITPKKNKYTDFEATLNDIEFSEFDFNLLDVDEDILKVMMIDESELLSNAIPLLPTELQEKYSMARSTPHFYEFMNKDSNKGKGMAALTAHLGLTAEQIICVGDAANDLEMIQFAGLGVAMENATDAVKYHADYITASNDQEGVAHVFEKYILK
ncbi:Cof-type HAD-IIB family hydrolase [Psychromonas antarctica]|jgi:Cof subfamily protein (haloacid dehalogenase superfamily)|uniref:Cof-type HAD-IIB family hydrolase n=1 Tax=Psychromonas antarctica TaxID=67573 RepID=UPI001EE9A9AE|nr:Cof-type HAD-IIB family hydrolase [Psychromonas antarctica]MCG6200895.1 Cof-type HAD-IIB family hydrolase [Psychromonas antarctica]